MLALLTIDTLCQLATERQQAIRIAPLNHSELIATEAILLHILRGHLLLLLRDRTPDSYDT